jgi:CheY-like chemotaxis protein
MLTDATPGPHILLQVSDTGSGIPAEILERIFDPFFTTKGIGQGTGLGLSTVLGIVKNHGGAIRVNTNVGTGTTFQIYLPASPDSEIEVGESPEGQIPQGRDQLVLVVDDEASIRSTARAALEATGYRVLLASDGAEALAVFAMNSGTIALALTDLMMPYVDGLALIRALRALKPNLPIIASTGLGEKSQAADLKQMKVETILNKPYSADLLLRTVHSALNAKTEA